MPLNKPKQTASGAWACRLDRRVRRLVEDAPVFPRADPEELARFDVSTKRCTANCGPHRADPRSKVERILLCDDCLTIERKDMSEQECKHGVRAPHECSACVWETPDLAIWIQRIHDLADDAHTKDDGHCFALSEIVAMCRAAMVAQQAAA